MISSDQLNRYRYFPARLSHPPEAASGSKSIGSSSWSWSWHLAHQWRLDNCWIMSCHWYRKLSWTKTIETIMINYINSIATSQPVYRIHQKQQAAPNLSVVHHDLGLGILRINEDLVIVESCLVIDTASLIDTASPLAEYYDFGHGIGRNSRGSLRIPRGKHPQKSRPKLQVFSFPKNLTRVKSHDGARRNLVPKSISPCGGSPLPVQKFYRVNLVSRLTCIRSVWHRALCCTRCRCTSPVPAALHAGKGQALQHSASVVQLSSHSVRYLILKKRFFFGGGGAPPSAPPRNVDPNTFLNPLSGLITIFTIYSYFVEFSDFFRTERIRQKHSRPTTPSGNPSARAPGWSSFLSPTASCFCTCHSARPSSPLRKDSSWSL